MTSGKKTLIGRVKIIFSFELFAFPAQKCTMEKYYNVTYGRGLKVLTSGNFGGFRDTQPLHSSLRSKDLQPHTITNIKVFG